MRMVPAAPSRLHAPVCSAGTCCLSAMCPGPQLALPPVAGMAADPVAVCPAADMAKLSSSLASESKMYSKQSKDLYRQVGGWH
jgi:hypothetical protein